MVRPWWGLIVGRPSICGPSRSLAHPRSQWSVPLTEDVAVDQRRTHTRRRQIADVETATVRDDRPLAVREAQAQPGTVRATLLERMKQLGTLTFRKAATFILDFHKNPIDRRNDPERDGRPGSRELERVLHQIVDGRGQVLLISQNLGVVFRGHNPKCDVATSGLQGRGGGNLADKLRDRKDLWVLSPASEPHVCD